jgi:hypothetical protein
MGSGNVDNSFDGVRLLISLPVHDGMKRAEKEGGEQLVVEGEDDKELVECPYLSMMV